MQRSYLSLSVSSTLSEEKYETVNKFRRKDLHFNETKKKLVARQTLKAILEPGRAFHPILFH